MIAKTIDIHICKIIQIKIVIPKRKIKINKKPREAINKLRNVCSLNAFFKHFASKPIFKSI